MNTLHLTADSPELLATCRDIIHKGGLIGIPTETVYGLGANGLDPEAVLKIFRAKGRPQDNPLILHVSGKAQVENFCHDIPREAYALMDAFWPGPLTLVLPAREIVPKGTTAGLDTVAVRCPDHSLTRAIIDAAGVPLAAPSANISGKPSPTTAAHVLHDMDGKIDAVVDGGACRVGVESTIVDLTGERPRLLRPGGITPAQLRAVIGELDIDEAVLGEPDPTTIVRAPGMKYTHYTPSGEVIIVTGSGRGAARYILKRLGDHDRVLCFSEELSLYPTDKALSYGSREDPETLAQGLFGALRALDSEDIETIYARCPEDDGAGFAVANRLKKAAGFHMVKPMTVLGITGPTGSGKTTMLRCVEERGGCVLDLDAVYHGLLKTDKALLSAIHHRFPGVVRDGVLDRKALGNVVFADGDALRDLSEITGKFILAETDRLLLEAEDAGIPLAAIDAINLLEGTLPEKCDHTIAVTAPLEIRVGRLMLRDNISEEYARLRISAQKPAEYFEEHCEFTLRNEGTPEEFRTKCEHLINEIITKERI